jgi:hypothetical protein
LQNKTIVRRWFILKITKLPNSIDPNMMVRKAIRDKYKKCPCCGESRDFNKVLLNLTEYGGIRVDTEYFLRKSVTGIKCLLPKYWFEPSKKWCIDHYTCETCKAEWDSVPYPVDILDYDELNTYWEGIVEEAAATGVDLSKYVLESK